MSKRMWKVVEVKARKIGMAKTKIKRSERGKKEEEEEKKEIKDNRDKESSRWIEDLKW